MSRGFILIGMKNEKIRGRPKEFDCDQALAAALDVFWRKGYEGASLADLTEAMGISRPSLYATYGNKENLFKLALNRYMSSASCVARVAQEMPTLYEAVKAFFEGAAMGVTNPDHPGCLTVTGALACSEESEAVQTELCNARNAGLLSWQARIEQGKAAGELPADADSLELARYIMTIATGMSVQARSGATSEDLLQVASIALQAWPTRSAT